MRVEHRFMTEGSVKRCLFLSASAHAYINTFHVDACLFCTPFSGVRLIFHAHVHVSVLLGDADIDAVLMEQN